MPATLKDISKQSGYSVTTVSRALTGYDDVSAKTRAHIIKVADELGYQPNQAARQLKGQRTLTLGFVMPKRMANYEDDFFSLLLRGITYEAAHHGYDILISATHANHSELDTYKRFVEGQRVDAMIVARTYRNDQRIRYLQSCNVPFIVHGRLTPEEQSDFHYIDVDSQMGIRLLTDHLLDLGHQHIGIILPQPEIAFTDYRWRGYVNAHEARNIAYNEAHHIHGDLTYQSGVDASDELLNRSSEITAIIATNDWMALGAMKSAEQHGRRVGDDIAIVGYDDIPAASQSHPSLTTIHQPIYDVGTQLTKQILGIIEDQPTTYHQSILKPRLVIRESSGDSR